MSKTDQKDFYADFIPLVSIIVPVYMVEAYLKRCLDSILDQTYPNFEVILVDDGSPDNSGKICDEYSRKNNKIRTIHQNNQGVSAARNNAVKMSNGEYITFIDPDDFVTPDYTSYLVSLLRRFNADISVGSSIYQPENKAIKTPGKETKAALYNVGEALIQMNYTNGFGAFAWGKMYKKVLVESNPYPIGKRYEDLATTYKIIGASTGVAFGNKQIYYWLQRPSSFMHESFSERQLYGIEAAKDQLDYIQKKYPVAVNAAKYRYTAKAVELTGILFSFGGDKKYFKLLSNHMQKYAKEVLLDRNTKYTMKYRIIAMKLGYYPAKLLFKLFDFAKQRFM